MDKPIVMGKLHAHSNLNHAVINSFHVLNWDIEAKVQIYCLDILVHVTAICLLLQAKLVRFVSLCVLEGIEAPHNIRVWRQLYPV